MTTKRRTSATPLTVVIVGYPGLQSLDAVGPFEVFGAATQVAQAEGRRPGYRPVLVSREGGLVRSESGLALWAEPLSEWGGPIDTLVLSGGPGVDAARQDSSLVDWVREAAGRSRRVATVCSGAFLAAQAGLLEGRRVTTHWARAKRLARDFPGLEVDADPIYLRDGKYWSSAGVTAGIDLALALVRDDLGADAAQTVARWLVMFFHRPGGQTQFATPVWVPRADRPTVRAVQERIESDPGADHRMPVLAESAAMSVRHFARVFTEEVGLTPARYVEKVRVEAARRQLEETDDTLPVVATACGFGSEETLRRAFHRQLGVPPDAYRHRFGAPIQPDDGPYPLSARRPA
jgi:transcriptional regulator GlxA family with amidase domain